MQAGLNSDDEEFITQEERDRRNLAQQMDDIALRFVLSTRQGRRWVWKHLGKCGVGMNPFAGSQREVTDFNCGRQSVGQELLVDIDRVRPGSYIAMINEAKEDEEYVRPSSSDTDSSRPGGEFNSITALAGDTSD